MRHNVSCSIRECSEYTTYASHSFRVIIKKDHTFANDNYCMYRSCNASIILVDNCIWSILLTDTYFVKFIICETNVLKLWCFWCFSMSYILDVMMNSPTQTETKRRTDWVKVGATVQAPGHLMTAKSTEFLWIFTVGETRGVWSHPGLWEFKRHFFYYYFINFWHLIGNSRKKS